MIFIVKYKAAGRTNQTILRICTEKSECYKQMSNGEKHLKRNCEFWPTCKCQKHAELIAYRPVLCNGVKVPRIQCCWVGKWVLRFIGAAHSSTAAYERMRAEQNTDAGRAAHLGNSKARYVEQRKYDADRRDEKLKYNTAHRDERREYNRKYYLEHKK